MTRTTRTRAYSGRRTWPGSRSSRARRPPRRCGSGSEAMMRTQRVRTEADLPPRDSDVRVSWEPQLGEPAKLRTDWCAFLAGEYDQPVGGVHREPSRPFGEVLADTRRQNLGLW